MTFIFFFLVLLLSSLAVFAGVTILMKSGSKFTIVFAAFSCILYAALLFWQPQILGLSNLGVLLVAASIGSLIGRMLETKSALLVFIVTASLVDMFSFSGGLTNRIVADYVQQKSLLLQYLCISLPFQGEITPVIGVGDLVILAAVFYALMNLRCSRLLAFCLPVSGLLIALGVGLAFGGIYAVPFMGAALVIFLLAKLGKKSSRPGG